MNILAITANQLFPHSPTASQGIFFANFLRNLQPYVGCIRVVAPQAWVPAPLRRLPRFAGVAAPSRHDYFGMEVYRPAFFSLAATSRLWFQARSAVLAAMPLCRRLHEESRFDLIVGHGLDASAQLAICAARELRLPCVNWAIGGDVNTSPSRSSENARLLRHVVRYSGLVLTFSDALRRQILTWCPGATNVRTFYWGTDLRDVPPPAADRRQGRAALGLAPERRYVISVGHATGTKGTREFYEAFRRLAVAFPDLSAIWVGDGPDASPLRDQACRDDMGGRFAVTGMVPHAKVLQYMHAADVMAFATYTEGLPNVIVEAMASGLPIVTTPVGGIPEIIADGRTGRLVPVKDARALAEAVEEVLRDAGRARQWGEAARAFVLRYLDGRVNAPIALDIFRRLCEGTLSEGPLPVCANLPPGRLPIESPL